MTQYIDKDALIAEIENLENRYKKCPTRNSYEEGLKAGRLIGYKDALHKINTLEVKEKHSLTPEEIKKICTIYDNLKQERECATVLYNSDETFFNHVLMEYKSIAQKGVENEM